MSSTTVAKTRSAHNGTIEYPSLGQINFSPSTDSQSHWAVIKSLYIFSDACFLAASGLTGCLLLGRARAGSLNFLTSAYSDRFGTRESAAFFMIYGVLVLLASESQRLYAVPRARSARHEIAVVGRSVLLALVLMTACLNLLRAPVPLQLGILLMSFLSFVALSSWREIRQSVVQRKVERGVDASRVLIVGMGNVGKALALYLDDSKHLGYFVVGFLDEEHLADSAVLGKPQDLIKITREHFIDEVFLTTSPDTEMIRQLRSDARQTQINLSIVTAPLTGTAAPGPSTYFCYPIIEYNRRSNEVLGPLAKRCMDIFSASALLIGLAPLMLAVALAIKFDSAGPVFYRSKRLGRNGRLFTCFKFRTMVLDAQGMRARLAHLNERAKIIFKIDKDPRITSLGKFLRKYSLDELPQLWSVLAGDMSLVGPRPPVPEEYVQYDVEHRQRLRVKPGITGLWQVTARRDPSFDNYMKLDLEYVANWTIWWDCKILLKTIPAVLRGTGS
jgi:exopolysaccharide biosynthesis polyprenyl glycosylphosphotransferase